jgi:hypothetical protein
MKFWERFGIGIMSLWGVFALHQGVNALVRAHNWQPMTISDWGTWIGSIGTVATLIGTIWLATSAERRKRQEDLGKATVAAARMAVRIPVIQSSFSTVRAFLANTVFDGDPRLDYAAAARHMQDTGTWSNADVDPLIHMSGGRVAMLEMTRSRIELVCKYLLTTSTSHRLDSSKASELYIQVDSMLRKVEEELAQHLEAFQAFLQKYGLGSGVD